MATLHVAVDRGEVAQLREAAERAAVVVDNPTAQRSAVLALIRLVRELDVYSLPAVVEAEIRAGTLTMRLQDRGDHTGPVHT